MGHRLRVILAALGLGLVVVVAGAAGMVIDQTSPAAAQAVREVKTNVRQALGLPKTWNRRVNADVAAATRVACPDDPVVIVTGGQSNAANALSLPVDEDETADATMFFRGDCYRMRDPVLGATAVRGSLWTQLGQRLSHRHQRPFLFINGAVGGSQYSDWTDERSGYLRALMAEVERAAEQGYAPDFVLWHQGETDAAGHPDADALTVDITRLVNDLRAGLPEDASPRFVLFQASRCTGAGREDGVPAVIAAQRKVAAEHPWVEAGPNTDRLGRRFRYDDCHFNAAGRDAVVEDVAEMIGAMLPGTGS